MLDPTPESKRTRTAVRFFTYGVMTISTIVISAIALLFALGYRFDNESLTLEQGGLVQFISSPNDATVLIDDERQSFRTPGKKAIDAGEHEIVMRLDGYRDWRKTVQVEPGQIRWLNYARFIPQRITTTEVRELEGLHMSLTSPNRRYIALQPASDKPTIIMADIRDEDNVKFSEIVIPEEVYSSPENHPHTFELVEWNLNGRYLLVRHTAGGIEEFIRVDRQNPTQAINLSTSFGPIKRAQFAGNNGNVVFAEINNELRRLAVDGSESELLVSGVTYFVVYRGDTIGFIADRNDQREVGILKDDRETLVQEYPAETPLKIALSHYFNRDYIAIAHENKVELIRDPADAPGAVNKALVTYEIDQPSIDWLYFSNNGRFLVAQHQSSFTTYDLELNETYERTFNTNSQVTRPFRWLDDYYLWIDLDDNLRIVEFDGANERAITSVATGYVTTLSNNAEVIFSIGRNGASDKLVLQRSVIVLNR